jgi:hypothetical protein
LQVLFLPLKGKSSKKYFNGKYPRTIKVVKAEKCGGLPKPHFLFLFLATFEAIILANTMPYAKWF